ncbi:TPA: hypothetical protein SL658_000900 [Pseudomonas aeruginosa]|uniref:hypothetical protein n=1 Tax=Pseudomonas aeruginosa TaxID=287 RepID=UPI00188768E2|nr:hypothetical protein [Pseudomonas aeruginosa]MBF1867500.1 hypothetical protein [Pseudomonas aeruginosa]HCF9849677.1 hypothetical protein [Pseudomonas aeruginosa]HEJ5133697.1 hypothetical protein [Pseudomonas aeruginosa]
MKKTLLISTIMILTSGCSDESSKPKGEFLSGCMRNGAAKAVCECTYNKLEKEYTLEGLIQESERAARTGPSTQFIQSIARAAQACQ